MIRWVRITDSVRIGHVDAGGDGEATIIVSRIGIGSHEHRITLVHSEHATYGEMTAQRELVHHVIDGDPHATEFVLEHLWANMETRDAQPPITCDPAAMR